MLQRWMKGTFCLTVSGLYLSLTLSQFAFGAQEPRAKNLDSTLTQTILLAQESKAKEPDAVLTSSAFTYQGQLKDANGPVNGAYDLQFSLYSAQTGGEKLGANERQAVSLTNGMFSFKLDFGRATAEAKESWLEIGVRPSGNAELYNVLFPRQKLTPTPYAIFAQRDQWSLIGVPVGFIDQPRDQAIPAAVAEEVARLKGEMPAAAEGKAVAAEAKSAAPLGTPNFLAKFDAAGNPSANSILFDNGANAGIGTMTPDTRLNLNSSAATSQAVLTVSNGNADTRLALWSGFSAGANPPALLYTHDLRFGTVPSANFASGANFSEAMRITSSGRVGIGTGNPQNLLHVGPGTSSIVASRVNAVVASNSQDAGIAIAQGSGVHVLLQASGAGGYIGTTSNHPLVLRTRDLDQVVVGANGNVGIGTGNPQAKLDVIGMTRTGVLQITGGGDLSEPFEITGAESIQPGMLVAIDPEQPGQLRIANKAYDRTVAGIISGANGINPGLTMKQAGTVADGAHPVALTGRVYCWADASHGSIEPGDLLTTSNTPGHAMKVRNHRRAQGAIIGKAMTRLERGEGLVLVLVMPQ